MRAAALLVLAAAVPPDDGGTRHFWYQRPVLLDGGMVGETCVAVPPDVFPHAALHLGDLRLFQGEREVPYALRIAAARPVAGAMVREVTNRGTVRGETTFEADPPTPSYNQVALEVSAHDFIATVTVTGSHDLRGTSQVTLGSFTIFDFTSQRLGRSMVLHLPTSNFEHLRFQIDGHVKPEDVTGVTFQAEVPAADAAYVTAASGAAFRRDGHRSVLDLILPPHVPVDRTVFLPGSGAPAAFSRDVAITETPEPAAQQPDDQEPFAPHASGNLQRVHREEDGRRVDVENLTVDTDGTAAAVATRWRITVENGDDTPLPLQAVELRMRQRDLCFENTGGAPYTLYYGDNTRTAPSYDYQRLFAPVARPARVSLGAEGENADYLPPEDRRPFSERHPALLWAGLLLTIAALGAVALRSARPAPGGAE